MILASASGAQFEGFGTEIDFGSKSIAFLKPQGRGRGMIFRLLRIRLARCPCHRHTKEIKIVGGVGEGCGGRRYAWVAHGGPFREQLGNN